MEFFYCEIAFTFDQWTEYLKVIIMQTKIQ